MDERSKELQLEIRKKFLAYNAEAKAYFYSFLDKGVMSTPEALQRTKEKFGKEYLLWLVFTLKHKDIAPRTLQKAKELREEEDGRKED